MKKNILFFIFLLVVFQTVAQTDTAFWFAPSYVNPSNGNAPVFLRMANSTNQPTNVRVYTPANAGGVNINVVIPANGDASVDLTPFLNLITDTARATIKNTGLKIESQRAISAYYEVVGRNGTTIQNPEIFVLKGGNALGRSFYIPTHNFWKTDNNPDSDGIDGYTLPGWYQGRARSTIDIVAVNNNTRVTITPSNPYRAANGTIVTNLAPFLVILNRGQVYTLEAALWAADKHLGGTKVTADKPIAITDKDDTVKEGAGTNDMDYGYDLLGDQLVPDNVVGCEYLVIKGYLATTPTGINDFAFIVPTKNNTYINVDGVNLPGGPFAAGQVVRYQVIKEAVRVFSSNSPTAVDGNPSNPVYVYHVTGVANELASAILPSTNCSGSRDVTFTRTDLASDLLDFYVNIIVRDGGQNSFTVNGTPLASNLFSAPIGGWRYARILNSTIFPRGVNKVANSSTVFHLAIFFGGSRKGASYGYFSDFGSFKVDLGLDKFNCSNDIVTYTLPTYPSVVWKSTSLPANVSSNQLVVTKSGQYIVTIKDNNNCISEDTVTVTYAPEVKIEQFDKSFPICKESDDQSRTILAILKTFDKYRWDFPNGTVVNDVRFIRPILPGKYKLTVTNLYGTNKELSCSASDEADVKIISNFFQFKEIGDNITLCTNAATSYNLDLNYAKLAPPAGINGVSIEWFKNNVNLNIANNIFTYSIQSQGEFKAIIRDKDRCKLRDSVFVNYVDKINVTLGGDSVIACLGDPEIQTELEFVANPSGNYNYFWTAPAGVNIPNNTIRFKPTVPGRYTLNSKDKNFPDCAGSASTFVIRPLDSLNAPWNNKSLADCVPYGRLDPICGSAEATIFTWYKNNQIIAGEKGRCYGKFEDDSASYRLVMEKFYTASKSCKGDAIAFIKHYDSLNVGLTNGDQPFCFPHVGIAKVAATAGFDKYVWTPNVSTSNTFEPTKNGKFELEVTNKDGCIGKGFTNVILVPQINLGVDKGDVKACWYADYTIRPGEGFGKYEWFNTDNPVPTNVSTYKPTKSGIYKVVVTTLVGNCKDSASVNIDYINEFNFNIGSDLTICDNATKELTLTTDISLYDSFNWYYGSTTAAPIQVGGNVHTPPIPIITDAAFIYNVIGKAEILSCFKEATARLTYIKTIQIGDERNDVKCIGDTSIFDIGEGFDIYIWKQNDLPLAVNNPSKPWILRTNIPGEYSVDLRSICGIQRQYYTLTNFDEIKLRVPTDTSVCIGKNVILSNIEDPNHDQSYSYVWQDILQNNKIIQGPSNTSSLSRNSESFLKIMVQDINRCKKESDIRVTFNDDCFKIPNLITPGGADNVNNTFEVEGMYPGEWAIEIYNRWGDRVYKNEQYSNEWGGENVNDGIYYYNLKNDKRNKEYKGWIHVVNN